MPDATFHRSSTPPDWGSAFAALGSETPPAGGWEQVSRALEARGAVTVDAPRGGATDAHCSGSSTATRTRRGRTPLWLASAAGIGAVAVVAMLLLRPQPERADRPSRAEVAVSRPDSKAAPPPAVATTGTATSVANTVSPSADRLQIAAATAAPMTPSISRQSAPDSNARTRARPLRDTDDRPVAAAMPSDDDATVLASLLAESARLEALIALANDDSVASGSGLVLAGELRDRIGQIDAALAPGDLDQPTRASLWQQRIDALRELAGLQSTQRWLAANGERYDGALVSVH